MEWNNTLIDLRCAISDLIQDKADIGRILNDAGIESKKIDFNKTPENIWHDTLYKVKDNRKQVEEIIEIIKGEHGENPTFQKAEEAYKRISEAPPSPIPGLRLPDLKPDYKEFSNLFREGLVIPFLGSDIVEAVSISSGDAPEKEFVLEPPLERDLAQKMADNGSFPKETWRNPLPVISQRFKTDVSKGSRSRFYKQLKKLFPRNVSPGPVHEFLVKQERPMVVVTTCYDTLLEDMFREQRKPFAVVTHVAYTTNPEDLGKVVVQYSDRPEAEKPICSDHLSIDLENWWVFYKIRGSFDLFTQGKGGKEEIDSIMISEEDYFSFMDRLKTQERTIPNLLVPLFGDRTFLFLGYWMTSWNFRTIFHFLYKKARSAKVKSYAVHKVIHNDPAGFEKWFWENDDVQFIDMGVSEFICELAEEMKLDIKCM